MFPSTRNPDQLVVGPGCVCWSTDGLGRVGSGPVSGPLSEPLYHDRDGQPITSRQWGYLRRWRDYWVIAQEQVGPYWVSTVWLGLDHGFGRPGPPVIFETMVFGDTTATSSLGEPLDRVRYATEAEARAGHAAMVLLVRATTPAVDAEHAEGSAT